MKNLIIFTYETTNRDYSLDKIREAADYLTTRYPDLTIRRTTVCREEYLDWVDDLVARNSK